MGESLTALYLQNPELANAIRRRQSGVAMMQQGTDASPIQSPYQGLSRLAQALLGGYEARKGDEEIKGVGEKRSAMLQSMFADDIPAAAPQAAPQAMQPSMTAPQAPVARAPLAPPEIAPLIQQASDQTGIPAPILTALYAQESGFRPDARNPRSTAAGIGQVLSSTAANPGFGMPPLADADRLDPAKAIPWSAQYLGARARSLGVSDWNNPDQVATALRAYGENTPEYAQAVLSRAGMAQGGGSAAALANPPTPAANPLAEVQQLQRRAQQAAAMGDTGLASIFMQRAQMAQQVALQRAPQETEAHRTAVAAGLVPGSPEYQNAMRGILEGKARGQTTNITMPPQTQTGPIPPGFQLVQRDGGLRMEAIPGGPADRTIAKEGAAAGAKREGEIRTSNIVLEDIDRITRLMDTSILPTTGLGAGTAAMVPGTGASDVGKLLEGIKANIGFDQLSKMRAESPTGAALGAVTERELQFLQAVRGSLDQAQSPEQFKFTLQRLRDGFAEVVHGPKWREVVGGGETTPAAGPAGNDMPTIADPAEASRLPPGTVFRTPDGRQFRVPNR